MVSRGSPPFKRASLTGDGNGRPRSLRAAATTEGSGNAGKTEVSHDGSKLPPWERDKFDVHREGLSRRLEGSGENSNGGKRELHCYERYMSRREVERVVGVS